MNQIVSPCKLHVCHPSAIPSLDTKLCHPSAISLDTKHNGWVQFESLLSDIVNTCSKLQHKLYNYPKYNLMNKKKNKYYSNKFLNLSISNLVLYHCFWEILTTPSTFIAAFNGHSIEGPTYIYSKTYIQ